jgi:uncharacterized DUF497 family protein
VKTFRWDLDKNEELKDARHVSFEEVLLAIERGDLLDIVEHPNKSKYPAQKMFIVAIREYAYLVPFVESKDEIFLKTIIPSRKATRSYLK